MVNRKAFGERIEHNSCISERCVHDTSFTHMCTGTAMERDKESVSVTNWHRFTHCPAVTLECFPRSCFACTFSCCTDLKQWMKPLCERPVRSIWPWMRAGPIPSTAVNQRLRLASMARPSGPPAVCTTAIGGETAGCDNLICIHYGILIGVTTWWHMKPLKRGVWLLLCRGILDDCLPRS